ncbi:hypothetical protein [Streptomyces lydicus]|uniref:hypothetical protein n=1 Tax=Streptomyces lydicus TaxID=47763 RepID=UPI0037B93B76
MSGPQLAAGGREFLYSRAASGRGMNWRDSSALLGTDRPEEVDAAFERGEELVGVAVIGLALTHPHATAILPDLLRRCPRGSEADDDLWVFVPRRRLPWWLCRHRLGEPPCRWLRRVGKVLSGARGGG